MPHDVHQSTVLPSDRPIRPCQPWAVFRIPLAGPQSHGKAGPTPQWRKPRPAISNRLSSFSSSPWYLNGCHGESLACHSGLKPSDPDYWRHREHDPNDLEYGGLWQRDLPCEAPMPSDSDREGLYRYGSLLDPHDSNDPDRRGLCWRDALHSPPGNHHAGSHRS